MSTTIEESFQHISNIRLIFASLFVGASQVAPVDLGHAIAIIETTYSLAGAILLGIKNPSNHVSHQSCFFSTISSGAAIGWFLSKPSHENTIMDLVGYAFTASSAFFAHQAAKQAVETGRPQIVNN